MLIRYIQCRCIVTILITIIAASVLTNCKSQKIIKDANPIFPDEDVAVIDHRLAALPVAMPSPMSFSNWPYGDYYSELGTVNFAYSGRYQVTNQISYSGSKNSFYRASMPIIIDTDLFFVDGSGFVRSIDLITNKTKWKSNVRLFFDANFKSLRATSISYGDKKLYIATNNGYLIALSAKNGNLQWVKNLHTIFRAPWKHDGTTVYGISSTNITFAVNANTGALLWKSEGAIEQRVTYQHPSLLISNDIIISTHSSGEVIAFDKGTGAVQWNHNIMLTDHHGNSMSQFSDIDANPALFGDKFALIGGLNSNLYLVEIDSGRAIWSKRHSVSSQIAVINDFAFFIDNMGHFLCLHVPTGGIKWSHDLPVSKAIRTTRYINNGKQYKYLHINRLGPMLINNELLLVDQFGDMINFDPNDGKILSSRNIPYAIRHMPILVDGRLYMIDDESGYIIIMD